MGKKLQYTVVLGIISMITAVGVGATYVTTKEKIRQKEEARRMEALLTVLPGLEGQPQEVTPPGAAPEEKVYKGLDKDQKVIGYAALGQAQGYSSTIKTMVGLSPDMQKVLAVKVLAQGETPGLGTRVMEIATTKTLWKLFMGGGAPAAAEPLTPWFQEQFRDKALNQLTVVREADPAKIQAITGATISTRAVVASVENGVKRIKGAVK
ncbi:MAG: FMN-binding protein [Candidatus Brocadiaceae bacterium]|nr:FMN-binding protein [Candidatus Brocadiaceae bacterium]